MADRVAAVRRVVCDVVAEAVRAASAPGVLVLADWTPEGELVYEWLVAALGEGHVWREAGQEAAAGALTAHPVNRTALMLGIRVPAADLLPLGDLFASQVGTIAGGWSVPPAVQEIATAAGGMQHVDAALEQLLDMRAPVELAVRDLEPDAARLFTTAWNAGRWHRLHTRLVPKLSARTLGIDLFD